MCMNCMMGAMTAGAGATGLRAWLASRLPPRALKRVTAVLIALAVLAAAVVSNGGG